jgi:hypothetical protein
MAGREHRLKYFIVAALLVAALAALWPDSALAQCPLCRTALLSGGERTMRTMNLAILILLAPPVAIFCSIFAVAYKKIKGEDENNEPSRP